MSLKFITISMDGGSVVMILDLEEFFPCTQAQLCALYKKCIWHDWDRREWIVKKIIEFCREKAHIVHQEKEKRTISQLNRNIDLLNKFLEELQ